MVVKIIEKNGNTFVFTKVTYIQEINNELSLFENGELLKSFQNADCEIIDTDNWEKKIKL